VASVALLAAARTPTLVLGKVVPGLGAEVQASGGPLPAASYAVVCGLVAIPLLVCWCYWSLTHALGLRGAVCPLVAAGSPEAERLTEPLRGSAAARERSWVARRFAGAALAAAGLVPVACDAMLLDDYSRKFSFGGDLARLNGPYRLWATAAGAGGARPERFDNVPSDRHPSLYPWWQPWACAALLLGAALLLWGAYRQLGVWADVWPYLPAPARRALTRLEGVACQIAERCTRTA
jgi:hypothetical protein